MNYHYIRLDDACEFMDNHKWMTVVEFMLDRGVIPIIAVIPDCRDEKLLQYDYREENLNLIKNWQAKGAILAVHGLHHVYTTQVSGFYSFREAKSEFAGLPFDEQLEMVSHAKRIFFEVYGEQENWIWVSPSGTFDKNTLLALKRNGFDLIIDGYSDAPYKFKGLNWIPRQLSGNIIRKKHGIWGISLHPNTMSDHDIELFKQFIDNNIGCFEYNISKIFAFPFRKRGVKEVLYDFKASLLMPIRHTVIIKLLVNVKRVLLQKSKRS